MTPQDEQNLQSLSAELAAAEDDPHEPHCIMRAFGTPEPGALEFTMQVWVDLARHRSPLLDHEDFCDPDQAEAAARALGSP